MVKASLHFTVQGGPFYGFNNWLIDHGVGSTDHFLR